VVAAVVLLVCFVLGCVFYTFYQRRQHLKEDENFSGNGCPISCFSRGATRQSSFPSRHSDLSTVTTSRPSLLQRSAQSSLLRGVAIGSSPPRFVEPVSGDCVICSASSSSVLPLPCGHTLCVDDLSSYLLASLADSSLFPLRCPLHCQGCQSTVPLPLAQQLLSHEQYQRFLDYHERAIHGDGVRCIRCSTFIPLPDSRVNKIYLVACQSCTLVFCSQCKSLSHGGKRCPVDVDTDQFEGWVRKAGAMKCPACSRWIEKEDPETCNHMCHKATDPVPCVRDRTDFCCTYLPSLLPHPHPSTLMCSAVDCCGEEVLASHPHDEVRHPGVNHFPQGVFQKCRTVLRREREEAETNAAAVEAAAAQAEEKLLWEPRPSPPRGGRHNTRQPSRGLAAGRYRSSAVVPYG
jgi:hypothetical protein